MVVGGILVTILLFAGIWGIGGIIVFMFIYLILIQFSKECCENWKLTEKQAYKRGFIVGTILFTGFFIICDMILCGCICLGIAFLYVLLTSLGGPLKFSRHKYSDSQHKKESYTINVTIEKK